MLRSAMLSNMVRSTSCACACTLWSRINSLNEASAASHSLAQLRKASHSFAQLRTAWLSLGQAAHLGSACLSLA